MEAFQAAGVVLGVVWAGNNLGWGGSYEVPSAGLSLCPPGGAEATFLDGWVCLELDDHEVGGGDKGLVGQVEGAGQGGDIDSGVFGSAPAQDLDGVKVLLSVEFGELEEEK